MRRRRVRSSRGNHAAAITSSCAPTSTESEGRITDSATRSLRPGGGAEASSPRVQQRRRTLQDDDHPEGARHQSFTPGSATRRCRPVRSRRVCTSCCPIERRICSAWAWLNPPAAGVLGALLPPCPACPGGAPPPPPPPEGGLLRELPPPRRRTASSRFHLAGR